MAVPAPNTPKKKTHDEFNLIIERLNSRWQVGLPVRNVLWSPHKGGEPRDAKDCIEGMKYLFFNSIQELDEVLDDFSTQASRYPRALRVGLLLNLILPVVGSRRKAREEQRKAKTLIQEHEHERSYMPPILPTSSQLLEVAGHASLPPVSSYSQLTLLKDTSPETFYSAPSARSPSPPPSPSLEARERRTSGNRRALVRKRLSEESIIDSETHSLKYPRTSNGSRRTSGSKSNVSFHTMPPSPTRQDTVDSLYMSCPSTSTGGASGMPSFSSTLVTGQSGLTTANTSFNTEVTEEDNDSYPQSFPSLDGTMDPPDPPQSHARAKPSILNSSSDLSSSFLQEAEAVDVSFNRPDLSSNSTHLNHVREEPQEAVPEIPPPLRINLPLEHYQLRDLPAKGLFTSHCEEVKSHLTWRTRYEMTRIALANKLKVKDLISTASDFDLYEDLLTSINSQATVNKKILKPVRKVTPGAWKASCEEFTDVNLKASLSFTKDPASQPMCSIALEPLQLELSCRFQRRFGGDRFLYLTIPNLDSQSIPSHLRDHGIHFKKRFLQWLQTTHSFLGRSWRAVHLEPMKSANKFEERSKKPGFRVIFFAMEGDGIALNDNCSVRDMIHWFINLDNLKNRSQSYCKIFARLDLGFSKTMPTIVFKPTQIDWVPDNLASGEEEATEFNDESPEYKPLWNELRRIRSSDKATMNDGCCTISYGAALLIYKALGLTGPMFSAIQGRFGGAKGVWIVQPPEIDIIDPETGLKRPPTVRISVNDSQRKFRLHPEDRDDKTFDPNRLTLEVNRFSTTPMSSSLYHSFLPILHDRGVKSEDIQKFFKGILAAESAVFDEIVHDSVKCRRWMNQTFSTTEEKQRKGGILWQAELPKSNTEKINYFLEYGFCPSECPYLGMQLQETAESFYTSLVRSLKVKLPKSTMVLGIADPTGTLAPGEIYLSFSKAVGDETSGECVMSLAGKSVLVGRHPALRNSDIQRVRAVHKPELAHIVDVVVFSSRGYIPLAHRLQGGDYDGDTFWICWEHDLVKDFRNAPIQAKPPKPEDFQIEIDRTTLGEILQLEVPDPIGTFLHRSFDFRWQPEVLGKSTNLHEKLAYAENNINSPGVQQVADFHDLMIDAAKSGFICTEQTYKHFQKSVNTAKGINIHKLKVPAYKENMQTGFGKETGIRMLLEHEANPPPIPKHKTSHVIDNVYFSTIQPIIHATLLKLGKFFAEKSKYQDDQLRHLYLETLKRAERQAKDSSTTTRETGQRLRTELATLKCKLIDLKEQWEKTFPGPDPSGRPREDKGKQDFDDKLQKLLVKYRSIMPVDTSHPEIAFWSFKRLPEEPAMWPLLKASAFYDLCGVTKPKSVFRLAGRDLAYMKVLHTPHPRQMTEEMWGQMKVGKVKAVGASEAMYQAVDVTVEKAIEDDEDITEPDDDEDGEEDFFSTWNGVD
ncbi:hypothetical protein EJ08DRAFT_696920 [Tothia fuscella]|uniref:RNA-dependent RNA polymerase n=1 Tax=Tothia fuscella TaxID=1048955 RepID=A0A9P4NTF5_9PEZI|nr:hypothetical protein EJ08DRAFT_696920 [Tothia fuscella]